jgi:hypothetical protein
MSWIKNEPNLLTELTDQQQEYVIGGSSLSEVTPVVSMFAPGMKLPGIVYAPDLEGVINGAANELMGGVVPSGGNNGTKTVAS